MTHGLFEVNILAVVHCFQGNLGVPVIGSRDEDGVDIRAPDHFAVIEIAVAFEFLGVPPLALLIDIADADNLAGVVLLAVLGKHAGDVAASAARADYAHVDSIVSANDASAHLRTASGQGGIGKADSHAGRAGGLEEISAAY